MSRSVSLPLLSLPFVIKLLLGANRDSVFLDVSCGTGPAAAFTFCVTSKGLVCQFGPNRSMDRWVNLKVDRVFGLGKLSRLFSYASLRMFDFD